MRRGEKPIRYQPHALRNFQRRGIDKTQVERVIRRPDVQRHARRKGAIRLEGKLSPRRRLAVILEEDATGVFVITAFFVARKKR
jgi:hypothetical protein